MKRNTGETSGFTLIEVLIVTFTGLLLIAAAYITMSSGQKSTAGMERKVAAQQDVRAALEVMALELSMVSYNPNYAPKIWHDLPAFGGNVQCLPAAQTPKGIREASPTSLTIEMDLNGNNTAGDPGEIIRYAYEILNQAITRETPVCMTTRDPNLVSYFLGDNPLNSNPRTVRIINNDLNITNGNGQIAIFRFYNAVGNGVELYPHITPADIANIRRIDICLAAETDEVDPSTQRPRSIIYSTSVLVRNQAFGPS